METVEDKKKAFLESKLPNIALFLAMSGAFMVLAYTNRIILSRLIAGTFESDGEMVIVNLVIIFAVMAFGGLMYHVKLRKKVKADTALGNHPNVSHNSDKKASDGRSIMQLLRQYFYKKKRPNQQAQA